MSTAKPAPVQVKVSFDYLHAVACGGHRADLSNKLSAHMSRELCEFERSWVAQINSVGDKLARGRKADGAELSQIIWDGLKLTLQVAGLLDGLKTEIFGNGKQWQLVYVPPFFVEHTIFCGRRTGIKFSGPLLRRNGYVVYSAEAGPSAAGRAAFYSEFQRLLDGIDKDKGEEIRAIREELAVQMGG